MGGGGSGGELKGGLHGIYDYHSLMNVTLIMKMFSFFLYDNKDHNKNTCVN